MNTRDKNAAHFNAPKINAKKSTERLLNAHVKSGLKQEALRSPGLYLPEETEETEDVKVFSKSPTQEPKTDSYKAQKSNFSSPEAGEEMTRSPWKKGFWQELVDGIESELGGLFFLLRDQAWLDRIEGKFAFVATASEFNCTMLARKAKHPLSQALSESLGQELTVRFIVGPQRVMEAGLPGAALSSICDDARKPENMGEEDELAILHDLYGDVMGIVDNHPLFKRVQLPTERGGWGLFPQLLTNKCKEYGVMTVLKGLRYVANRPSAINKRAFFLHALDNGQFGYRLAFSAPTLGRVLP